MDAEKKRKQREWEREVQKMRDEFLQLHAVDRLWGSDELIVDPLVARRRGSTDILDARRMKTMYTTGCHESPTHRRYRLRFDLAGFDVDSVRVAVSGERIVVRASRVLDTGERKDFMRKVRPHSSDSQLACTSNVVITIAIPLRQDKWAWSLDVNHGHP